MPLGVQLNHKMKYEDMIDIMLNLHNYFSSQNVTKTVTVNGLEHVIEDKKMYPLLLEEDQLSFARYRGSKTIRKCSSNSVQCLEGLFPVTEDWNTEVTILKVRKAILLVCIFVVCIYFIR